MRTLIRATAEGNTITIGTLGDVHKEFTNAEDVAFEEWFLKNVDDLCAIETGLPMKFTLSDKEDGGCHMFRANRRFPKLAADAVGQTRQFQVYNPGGPRFLADVFEQSIPGIHVQSAWTPTDPLPLVPLELKDYGDELEFDAWLTAHADRMVDGKLVHGIWFHDEKKKATLRPVTITLEEVKAIWRANGGSWCRYFGVKGSWALASFSDTFDKIDASKGYEVGNLMICLDRANNAKSDYPISNFLSWRNGVMTLPWKE
ncbi:hypothetical protein HDU98_003103 [Podochytrium sp. JEL0797]|nr:hypothetical protein HDU98_003103 [Podochytrium sp. JEL0797]